MKSLLKKLFFILLYVPSYQLVAQTPQLVKLLSFGNTVCDMNSDPQRLRNRIIRKSIKQDTLTIEIGAKAICCAKFQPIFSYENGVLNLGIQPTGDFCKCDCCYTFVYTIIGLPKNGFSIKFREKDIELSDEKYLTFPVKFDVIKGDTVNLFDKYGLRQGLHLRFDAKKSRSIAALVYKNDEVISGSSLIKYYQNDKKKSERKFFTDEYIDVTYYENGIVKSECTKKLIELDKGSGKFMEFCNEYDIKGVKTNNSTCCCIQDFVKAKTNRILIYRYVNSIKKENNETITMSINAQHSIQTNHIEELEKTFEDKQGTVNICAELNVNSAFIDKIKAKLLAIGFENVSIERFRDYSDDNR